MSSVIAEARAGYFSVTPLQKKMNRHLCIRGKDKIGAYDYTELGSP
jgi:hypothetical protein